MGRIVFEVTIGSKTKCFHESIDVLDWLLDEGMDRDEVLDAYGWCDLASIGEVYAASDDFYIEVAED